MKILAIIGSPKGKGSGYSVVRVIENRMKAPGDVDFTRLFLNDADPKPRIGCYRCMAVGEDRCPLEDDRAAIEQALLAADGAILMKRPGGECRPSLPADDAFCPEESCYFDTSVNPIVAVAARAIVGSLMALWSKSLGPGDVAWPVLIKKEGS